MAAEDGVATMKFRGEKSGPDFKISSKNASSMAVELNVSTTVDLQRPRGVPTLLKEGEPKAKGVVPEPPMPESNME
jgi:hypothetical protein